MSGWTSGYVADIGYTYGYYPELNPVAAQFALLSTGHVQPEMINACELGFGQGLAVNMHAAASTVKWWGTDFNPSQAAFARELARATDSGAMLFDESFEEFCARGDLPEMDFIAVHGIWSWVNDENRRIMVDFVRRKLKVGGVLYMSYNTRPGWVSGEPLRELLVDHAETMGVPGAGIVSRIDGAVAFAEKLFSLKPRYAEANPGAVERLAKISPQDRHYIAHEFFNRDWEPMSFAKITDWLTPAKVGFACAAGMIEHVDALHLTPEQQAFLKEIPDARFRQSVRDLMVNAQFRKDYWIRGPRQMSGAAQRDGIDKQLIVLNKRAADVSLTIPGVKAESKLTEAVYLPLIEALADNKPKAIGDLLRTLKAKGLQPPQLLQAIVVLTGRGDVQPAQTPQAADAARRTTANLNRHLMAMAHRGSPVSHLASPVTGGAVAAPRFDQVFLSQVLDGEKTVDGWVRRTSAFLISHGQRLTREGKPITSEEETQVELKRQAKEFAEQRLDVYRALEVI